MFRPISALLSPIIFMGLSQGVEATVLSAVAMLRFSPLRMLEAPKATTRPPGRISLRLVRSDAPPIESSTRSRGALEPVMRRTSFPTSCVR